LKRLEVIRPQQFSDFLQLIVSQIPELVKWQL